MKRKLLITVTYVFKVDVDPENSVVKEYVDEKELATDLADYRFAPTLPVIEKGGVKIEDVDVEDVTVY